MRLTNMNNVEYFFDSESGIHLVLKDFPPFSYTIMMWAPPGILPAHPIPSSGNSNSRYQTFCVETKKLKKKCYFVKHFLLSIRQTFKL